MPGMIVQAEVIEDVEQHTQEKKREDRLQEDGGSRQKALKQQRVTRVITGTHRDFLKILTTYQPHGGL